MINPHRYCVIMCGGIGSRFWPYSRTDRPKQFIDFLGTGRTLLQMSYDRVLPLVDPEHIIIVTNAQYASLVKEQLPDIRDEHILLEPARRNTAPCIAWAAWHIAAIDPEASMIVTPSDHLITREREFEAAIAKGFEFVEQHDALLTLGISPTRPETGYGYIQVGDRVEGDILTVKTFTEKPNLELAKVFLESGEFFWNSGIFLWSARSIKSALMHHAPDIANLFERGADKFSTPAENEWIAHNFPGCMGISIDFAVMEKASNVYVETVNFGWNDLGTWSALYDNSPKNRDANVTQQCAVLAYNSTGNIFAVKNPGKLIVVDGLKDYIVADAGDVLLICPQAEEQRIKNMVNDAKISFGDKYL
ncbi:MAG: mannose-1-phosphate guanylyltransferase [Bacteroides uniformis]|uniref:mannose-1-phosphate guanylyltransferase n=1 Tax=Bacteroides uniformis TaxID=820 RepID=A0A1Q6I001_BACUN|nr:MAG: mannose-1-phosphate guanylyltransferase [Bacteroides uniformis]